MDGEVVFGPHMMQALNAIKTKVRGELLMQVMKWLGGDFYDWQTPIWMAHVAVEEFKCGCRLESDYDGSIEPDTCDTWSNSTEAQKHKLFEDVYGYSYQVWKTKVEAVMAQAEAEGRERMARQEREYIEQRRKRLLTRAKEFNVNPDLLP